MVLNFRDFKDNIRRAIKQEGLENAPKESEHATQTAHSPGSNSFSSIKSPPKLEGHNNDTKKVKENNNKFESKIHHFASQILKSYCRRNPTFIGKKNQNEEQDLNSVVSLDKLESLLCADRLNGEQTNESAGYCNTIKCKRSLLVIWNHLIKILEETKNSDQMKTCYFLIESIIERSEFDPNNSGSHTKANEQEPKDELLLFNAFLNSNPLIAAVSKFEKKQLEDLQLKKRASSLFHDYYDELELRHFRCMLAYTFKFFTQKLNSTDTVPNDDRVLTSVSDMEFLAKLTAVVYLYVPFVQQLMHKYSGIALENHEWPSTIENQILNTDENNEDGEASGENVTRKKKSYCGPSLQHSLCKLRDSFGTLNGTSVSKSSNNSKPLMNKWQKYSPFLDYINDQEVFYIEISNLTWLQKMFNDAEFFFLMFGNLSSQLSKIVINYPVGENWEIACPGYSSLLHICILILKESSWRQWYDTLHEDDKKERKLHCIKNNKTTSSSTKTHKYFTLTPRGVKTVMQSSGTLLMNPTKYTTQSCLLAVLETTNLYNSRSVGMTLNSFDDWFCKKRASYYLNNEIFLWGIKKMLLSENYEIINKVLYFFYKNMEFFEDKLLENVLKLLIQCHFMFFLHWNQEVRLHYHHLLVYIIGMNTKRNFLMSWTDWLLVDFNKLRKLIDPDERNNLNIDLYRVDCEFDNQTESDFPEAVAGSKWPRSSSNSIGGESLNANNSPDLLRDQSHWKAFDVCIGLICANERANAVKAHEKYLFKIKEAEIRANSFKKLQTNPPILSIEKSSINESLPGYNQNSESDLSTIIEENDTAGKKPPPYYLRYISCSKFENLQETCSLMNVNYDESLQIYASESLDEYSSLLGKYYTQLILQNGERVSPPPLGFY